MSGPQSAGEPAEHRRFAAYLRALEVVAEADEATLVAAVLNDQDPIMADGAVGRHLDRRAAQLLTGPRFPAWARAMAEVIDERDFLSRRLREWSLLRSIALGEPWAADELTGASDWFQRTAVASTTVTAPDALALLAEHGRTRRVRTAASRRLEGLERSS